MLHAGDDSLPLLPHVGLRMDLRLEHPSLEVVFGYGNFGYPRRWGDLEDCVPFPKTVPLVPC